jgi:homoserine dehydrogenase
MSDRSMIVLKFGSSVLRSEDDLPAAVHEIYRWVRNGRRVIVVVSALGKTTDSLLERAGRFGATPNEEAVAALVSTGEAVAAAELCLALDRAGIPACGLDAARVGILTEGPVLDASPRSVSLDAVHSALASFPVVVVAGFLGRSPQGVTTLLGRGGSDLTALFLAQQLGARCRLIKDVDGLYEWDPAEDGPPPSRFRTISWNEALTLTGRIVQHKAVQFACDHNVSFEVTTIGQEEATVVGPDPLGYFPEKRYTRPLRIGLLGLGTVGYGVYQELTARPDLFDVAGVAVRNLVRPAGQRIPRHLLTNNVWSIFDREIEVLVEMIGGHELPCALIEAALRAGIHVITANKTVIANDGARLQELARDNDVTLQYSAAAGGAVPMIETVRRLAVDSDAEIVALQGVLNGTTNYILDRLARGASFDAALKEAQNCGFAEADPTHDLTGIDAACKLILLAEAAFGVHLKLDEIERTGIDQIDAQAVTKAGENGKAIRLVASLRKTPDGVIARVAPQTLDAFHPLAQVRAERNGLEIEVAGQPPVFLTGKGAGRWPTTESVLADLFDLARSGSAHPPLLASLAVGRIA